MHTATQTAETIRSKPTPARAPRQTMHQLLTALVREKQDYPAVAAELMERAETDPVLRDEIRATTLSHLTNMAREAAAKMRAKVWNAPARPKHDGGVSRVIALTTAVGAALMDFPLPGGTVLRGATGAEVAAAAGFYEERANDAAWKGRWLRMVAANVPDGAKVGDAIDEAWLVQLRQEAAA